MTQFDLVLSSGGTRGIAFIGALEVLSQKKHSIRRMIGTSAGAICASMIAAGYSPKEWLERVLDEKTGSQFMPSLLELLPSEVILTQAKKPESETKLLLKRAIELAADEATKQVMDIIPRLAPALRLGLGVVQATFYNSVYQRLLETFSEHPQLGGMISLLEFGGFYGSKKVIDWLTERFREKIKNFEPTMTLAQFYKATEKDLSLVAADTIAKEALILNHRTAPDCPIVEAVRMSMSVPFVWEEVIWKSSWGKYLGTNRDGHAIVDGGLLLNFPLHYMLFPEDVKVKKVMGEAPAEKASTLGILLDDHLTVPGEIPGELETHSKTYARLENLLGTLQHWEEEARQGQEKVICRIPTRGYAPLSFTFSPERLRVLVDAGRCAMTDYLKREKLD